MVDLRRQPVGGRVGPVGQSPADPDRLSAGRLAQSRQSLIGRAHLLGRGFPFAVLRWASRWSCWASRRMLRVCPSNYPHGGLIGLINTMVLLRIVLLLSYA